MIDQQLAPPPSDLDTSSQPESEYVEKDTILEKAMAEILPLFELSDDDFELASADFVAHRVAALSENASRLPVSLMNGATEQFIDAQTPMVRSGLMTKDYYLDDNQAYVSSFKYVRDYYKIFKKRGSDDRVAYVSAVIHGTNAGQVAYFESYYGNQDMRDEMTKEYITDEDLPEQDRISIADLKRVGVCLERAGVTHNALQIFGMPSRLETGRLSVVNDDGSVYSELHAFITTESSSGEKLIYDPTNPKIIRNESGQIINSLPATYPITLDGQNVTGTLIELTKDAGGNVSQTRSSQVTYEFEAINRALFV